jgi:hypothetical protein
MPRCLADSTAFVCRSFQTVALCFQSFVFGYAIRFPPAARPPNLSLLANSALCDRVRQI